MTTQEGGLRDEDTVLIVKHKVRVDEGERGAGPLPGVRYIRDASKDGRDQAASCGLPIFA
jgi:hypothetical protein